MPHAVEEEGGEGRGGGGVGMGTDEGVVEEGCWVWHLVEHAVGVVQVAEGGHGGETEELAENHRVLVKARAERVSVDQLQLWHATAPLCHVDKC